MNNRINGRSVDEIDEKFSFIDLRRKRMSAVGLNGQPVTGKKMPGMISLEPESDV